MDIRMSNPHLHLASIVAELKDISTRPGNCCRAIQLPLLIQPFLHLPTGIIHGGLPLHTVVIPPLHCHPVHLLVPLYIGCLLLVPVRMIVRSWSMPEPLVPHSHIIVTRGKAVTTLLCYLPLLISYLCSPWPCCRLFFHPPLYSSPVLHVIFPGPSRRPFTHLTTWFYYYFIFPVSYVPSNTFRPPRSSGWK